MKNNNLLLFCSCLLALVLFTSCNRMETPIPDWNYTFEEIDGNATLTMDGVIIVFEGEKRSGSSSGKIRVSSYGGTIFTTHSAGSGDRKFTGVHSNGVNTMKFRQYDFQLFDEGSKLTIQGIDVDLSQGKKIVTVKEDGSVITENFIS